MAEIDEIRQAKNTHTQPLMGRQNVNGVGIGYKIVKGRPTTQLCLTVLVRQKLTEQALTAENLVPRSIDGIPTDVVQVGELWASQLRTDRYRPAPGGVSIGHYRITAGTLGAVVRDRATGDRLILSNNHVLANSNDAQAGDPIIQPGGADGGIVGQDTIAALERFCPISFNSQGGGSCGIASAYAQVRNAIASLLGSSHRVQVVQVMPQAVNLVDAAVARPLNGEDVLDEILGIGVITGTVDVALGMPVRKSGRTTEFTTGEILTIDSTVSVNYGSGRVATFENQLVAGPMSQGGDSGSLVVAGDSQDAVGLLFAGSDQSTIFNPIQAVLDCLDVMIG
ncbi:MAG: hypothetical protein Kow0080_02050 [Candidatus Promineifilaceae bacterium]